LVEVFRFATDYQPAEPLVVEVVRFSKKTHALDKLSFRPRARTTQERCNLLFGAGVAPT